MKKIILLLIVCLFISCSANNKAFKININRDIKDETAVKIEKTRKFSRKDYKKYEIDYKIYVDTKTYATAYDFDGDKNVDLYAYYCVKKIRYYKNKTVVGYKIMADYLYLRYNLDTAIFYNSLKNKKYLENKVFIPIKREKTLQKDSITISL